MFKKLREIVGKKVKVIPVFATIHHDHYTDEQMEEINKELERIEKEQNQKNS